MAERYVCTDADYDAILAALRYLGTALDEGGVQPNDGDVGDILTNSGTHAGLTGAEVHALADVLATAGAVEFR